MNPNPHYVNDGADVEMNSSGSSSASSSSSGSSGIPTIAIVIAAIVAGVIVLILVIVLPIVLTRGPVYSVPVASSGRLLVMVDQNTVRADGSKRIVARSYDTRDWEAVSDLDYDPVVLVCNRGTCDVVGSTGANFTVQEVDVPVGLPSVTPQQRAWRLFLQATFGASKADLDNFVSQYGTDVTSWVLAQQALPPTSHRQYLRKRVNLRYQYPTCMPKCPSSMGFSTAVCEVNSRWHRAVFTSNDLPDYGPVYEQVSVSVVGSYFQLTVNGELRGEVTTFLGNLATNLTGNVTFPNIFKICSLASESIGGVLQLGLPNDGACTTTAAWRVPNPAIFFSSVNSTAMRNLALNEAAFATLSGKPDAIILTRIDVSCPSTLMFLGWNNSVWRYDARLKLLEGSLQNPIIGSTSTAATGCATANRNFFNSASCKRGASCDGAYFDSCGSPDEVPNDPKLGARYIFSLNNATPGYTGQADFPYSSSLTKSTVWLNAVYYAPDQLRQRVAWALAQVFTLSARGLNFDPPVSEPYAVFYDIFVRNAFGKFRDMLKEVSFHPAMSDYLTYRDNRAYGSGGSYPDENYAREVMQLFSLGLYKLNNDGTQQVDSFGVPLATYNNDDIVQFARVWTGLRLQASRSNIESPFGKGDGNYVDFMQMDPTYRDMLPKAKLDRGYLGDGYPQCDFLPSQHWLKPGARFIFNGFTNSIEGNLIDIQNTTGGAPSGLRGRFNPDPATSALYQKLCAKQNNVCTFPSDVTLTEVLPCTGPKECNAGRVLAVVIYDPVANVTGYYTYRPVPCIRLALFDQGRMVKAGTWRQCASPTAAVAMPTCCNAANPTSAVSNYTSECLFANEVVTYDTAAARCAAMTPPRQLCSVNYTGQASYQRTCAPNYFQWVNASCQVQVQVYIGGYIALIDPNVATGSYKTGNNIFNISSGNTFRVRWANNSFPENVNGICGDVSLGCTALPTAAFGGTCLCNVTVTNIAVFTDSSTVPSAAEVLNALAVGAPVPSSFGNGVYSQSASSNGVVVWTKSSSSWDQNTIFEVPAQRAGGPVTYWLNFRSTVSIPGSSFSFRNPPTFMPQTLGTQPTSDQPWNTPAHWTYQSMNEMDALVDHITYHPNVAPFISFLLIQRLVTSNPSPRYVDTVATAFRTGVYNGRTFSGQYGDMAATVAAILLDQEARSPVLEADPAFGKLREPVLRLIHVMRALEYQSTDTREIYLPSLTNQLSQEVFQSPSVFGFYQPSNRPNGPLTDMGMASPEAQIMTTPPIIGMINGLSSLVDNGLTNCNSGFGSSCPNPNPPVGRLQWAPPNGATPDQIVDELDLLLTGGRMNTTLKNYIVSQYQARLAANVTATLALRYIQKMFFFSNEFHTTNANKLTSVVRPKAVPTPSGGRPYKAIIVLFLNGGLDSFNLLVPDPSCASLFQQYQDLRTSAALNTTQLLQLNDVTGQPCTKFAVHNAMPNLATMFNAGEASFIANIGPMVQPVSRADFLGTSGVKKKFPPSLFAHNVQQLAIQNLDPTNLVSKGVLGRAITALQLASPPYKAAMYSTTGTNKMVEGGQPLDFLDPFAGFPQYYNLNVMNASLGNFTQLQSASAFGETFSSTLQQTIRTTETLGPRVSATTLNVTFGTDSLSAQFRQVARLIKLRTDPLLDTERGVFLCSSGGYDTHNTFVLDPLLSSVDRALGNLSAELKAQGVWDSTVILTVSDFGRTLTSNGQGTDHSWGGNMILAGGAVQGGNIFGKFPDSFALGNSLDLGRGRQLPTSSWEAVWNGIVDWLDVPASEKNKVLPNLKNFPSDQVFTAAQMFRTNKKRTG